MKKTTRLAQIVLALALVLSGCALGARNADQPALSTPTIANLPGGLFPAPLPTLPADSRAQPAATTQPTLPPIATLVPTTSIPSLAPPTPTPAPRLDAACLTGAWQVMDLQQAMAGSLAQSGSSLALERVDGQARYIFSADGNMSLTYQQLAAVLYGTIDNREMRVTQSLDGTATARYNVNDLAGLIEMSAFGGEGIRSALEINGQTLAEGSLPVWLAFTRGQTTQPDADPNAVQVSRAAAACEGNTLTLQALEPVPGPAFRLERVGE